MAGESRHPGSQMIGRAYLQAARNLKRSIDRNRSDADFSSRDGAQIVYIFDTNVFIFHAYIKDRKRLTRNFDYLVGHDSPSELSRAMERLTADYLFSGHLPGQKDQRGYVSVPHFAEVLNRSSGIARSIDSAKMRQRQRMIRGEIGFDERIAAIIRSDTTPSKKLKRLGQIVPAAWLNALSASAIFTEAMRNAFLVDEPRLVPLDNAEWARDSIQLNRREVDEWKNAIARASRNRDPVTIQDDAETLATIVNLYRNTDTDRCRYVFVTADAVLARVIQKRMSDLSGAGVDDFLRTPQDYLPLLNINSMRLALGQHRVSDEVSRKFQNVFNILQTALDWLEVAWTDETLGELFATERPLSELQEAWLEASRYVTIINASHMAGSAPAIFKDLETFITRGEGAKAATERVQDTVEAVRERHLSVIVGIAVSALRTLRGGTDEHPQRRVEIQVVGELFRPLLPRRTGINAFLDEAVEKGRLPEYTLELLKIRPQQRESQLLVASLFVAAARWGAAEQFAARAYHLASTNATFRAEAAYLLALCLRFSMRSPQDYQRARQLLADNLAAYHARPKDVSGTLRRIRDEIELATVMLTAAVTQELAIRSPDLLRRTGETRPLLIRDNSASTVFAEGVALLRSAYETLLDAEPFESVGEGMSRTELTRFVRSLKRQAVANLVGAFVFERIVPGLQLRRPTLQPADVPLRELEALNKERQAAGQAARPTLFVYGLLAAVLTEKWPSVRAERLREAQTFLRSLDLNNRSLPFSDFLEFDFAQRFVEIELEEMAYVTRPAIPGSSMRS